MMAESPGFHLHSSLYAEQEHSAGVEMMRHRHVARRPFSGYVSLVCLSTLWCGCRLQVNQGIEDVRKEVGPAAQRLADTTDAQAQDLAKQVIAITGIPS